MAFWACFKKAKRAKKGQNFYFLSNWNGTSFKMQISKNVNTNLSSDLSKILWVLNLTSFSRSQRSKFKISPSGCTFRYYWTQRAVIWCDDVSRPSLCLHQISVQSDSKNSHKGALVKCKNTISEIMMIARVTKFSLCVSNAVTSHVLHMSVFTDFSRSQIGQSQKIKLGPSSH